MNGATSSTDRERTLDSSTSAIVVTNGSIHNACATLCSRLRKILNSETYPLQAVDDDPVDGIRSLFLRGIPLVIIYNLLPPHYPRINLSVEAFEDDEYCRRMAVALFSLYGNQFLRSERFSYEEISDEEGLHKPVDAVHLILDKIHESGHSTIETGLENASSPRPLSPYLNHSLRLRGSLEDKWMDCVRQLIASEHRYLNQIDLLEQYSKTLVQCQAISEEFAAHVFPRKTFLFMRKHLAQMDCIADHPWLEQRWGRFIKKTSDDLTFMYRIYCVNRILASEILDKVDLGTVKVNGNTLSKETFESLLDTPFNHLTEFSVALNTLANVSTEVDHPHHEELLVSRDALNFTTVFTAVQKAKTDVVLRNLEQAIIDWKDLLPDTFGLFVREEELLVRKQDVFQNLKVFLFENVLLYCDEALPEPLVTSRRGKRKLSSASARSDTSHSEIATPSMNIKGVMPCSIIQYIETSELERNVGSIPRIYHSVTIVCGYETISLVCESKDQMRSWCSVLEESRRASLAASLQHTPFISQDKASKSGDVQVAGASLAKVHAWGNSFVLNVSSFAKYEDFMENVERKMRLVGRSMFHNKHPVVKVPDSNGNLTAITPESDLATLFSRGSMIHLYAELEPDP
ncbi:Guanine nucleotide exchange factor for Cdc42p [Paramarasmius palmivorus]|uniref:Guanine nucleotide exchange factor for Cdc42p n=1 Tax=Paramarasmius palmivorus TaxID=297713 RepID=A0AAW0DXT0_9AGAR